MKLIVTTLMVGLLTATTVSAKGKNSSLEQAVEDEIRDALDLDDGKNKGKGKPHNPGEHGRDNAADKQRDNPGKGSKGGDSWEDEIRDEIFGDDDDKDKGGKNKSKKK